MSLKRLAVSGLLIILTGCQYVGIQSSQLTGVISLFAPKSDPLTGSQWAIQYGGYAATVQPITTETATMFVNEFDAITFDGWTISKVSGLRSFAPAWEIKDLGEERSFTVQGRVVAVHQCDSWLKAGDLDGVVYEQKCIGQRGYTNKILVDSLGQITNIEQVVDTSLKVLHLRLDI